MLRNQCELGQDGSKNLGWWGVCHNDKCVLVTLETSSCYTRVRLTAEEAQCMIDELTEHIRAFNEDQKVTWNTNCQLRI